MRTSCTISLENAFRGFSFSPCPVQGDTFKHIPSPWPQSRPQSPPLLVWTPAMASPLGFLPSFSPSSNPLGTQWPERSLKNTIWIVTILLLASGSTQNEITAPRASGFCPCLPSHHSLPTVTHRTWYMSLPQGPYRCCSLCPKCSDPQFYLVDFFSSFSLGLNITSSKKPSLIFHSRVGDLVIFSHSIILVFFSSWIKCIILYLLVSSLR